MSPDGARILAAARRFKPRGEGHAPASGKRADPERCGAAVPSLAAATVGTGQRLLSGPLRSEGRAQRAPAKPRRGGAPRFAAAIARTTDPTRNRSYLALDRPAGLVSDRQRKQAQALEGIPQPQKKKKTVR